MRTDTSVRYNIHGRSTVWVTRCGSVLNIADRNIDFIMAGENDAVRDRIKAQLLGQRSHASLLPAR